MAPIIQLLTLGKPAQSVKVIFKLSFFILFFSKSVLAVDLERKNIIDSLQQVIATTKNDSVLVTTYIKLGKVYRRINSDSTIKFMEELVKIAKSKDLQQFEAEAYRIIANVHRHENDFGKAKEFYRKSLKVEEKRKFTQGVVLSNICLMKCLILENGDEDSIRHYFDISILMKDSVGNRIWMIGDAYLDYASFLMDLGQYYSSMDNLIEALKIYEKINLDFRVYHVKCVLATIHNYLNNREKAKKIILDIAPKILKSKKYPLYAAALEQLAIIYKSENRLEDADSVFRRCLKINKEFNIEVYTDMYYSGLAGIKLDQNQIDSAIFYAKKALNVKNINNPKGHVANLQLGKAYVKLNFFERAESYFQNFLSFNNEHNKRNNIVEGYKLLAELNEKKGNYKKACDFHNLHNTLKDSLYTVNNSVKIADMEARFWNAQKRNELALSKKNEELKTKEIREVLVRNKLYSSQRNASLIAVVLVILFSILIYRINLQRRKNKLMMKVTELELKAIRAQMNPHFMFNALSVIQMLINKGEVKKANKALAKFGGLMRLILENSEKQTISLEEEINTLKLYIELEALRLPFNYSLEVGSDIDQEQLGIPAMLIQPYVENAIKHGLANKEKDRNVNIKFRKVEDQLFCTVEDDGVGRELAELSKSKYSRHKSMGTKLSKERLNLVDQKVDGEAKVEILDLYSSSGKPSGTRVELNIPLTYHVN